MYKSGEGYNKIPHKIQMRIDLSPISKLLYAEILNSQNIRTGWCYKSNNTLAVNLGVSPRSVSRAMQELKNLKLILILDGDGKRRGVKIN